MTNKSRKVMKLVGVFFLGCVFFNYPIMSLFNINVFLMGLPLFYVCLFSGWAVIILFILIITETGRQQNHSDSR